MSLNETKTRPISMNLFCINDTDAIHEFHPELTLSPSQIGETKHFTKCLIFRYIGRKRNIFAQIYLNSIL